MFKELGIDSIVFTESSEVVDYAKSLNVTTLPVITFNKYNLPVLRDLFIDARNYYNNEFIVYINADILISPDIFFFISAMYEKYGNKVLYKSYYYNNSFIIDLSRIQSIRY